MATFRKIEESVIYYMENKKISVIIPVYNAENKFQKLLNSLKNQTIFNNLEIIFVNDGSSDNSLSILQAYWKKYDNVKIINKENGGVSSARNLGIENSTSDYITFIDADDYIDDDYFEMFQNSINKKAELIVIGFITEYSSGYKIVKNYLPETIDNKEKMMKLFLLGKLDPNCWNKLYKRNIINKIRFDETMAYGEDKEMIFNYLRKCNVIEIISGSKYHYIINDDSVMRKQYNRKNFNTIDKSEKKIELMKEEYPNLVEYAISSDIDVKCRILCDIEEFKLKTKHKNIYKKVKNDIKKYSILKKKKYSTKKHFLAFLAIKMSPKLYLFLKKNMKLQYK